MKKHLLILFLIPLLCGFSQRDDDLLLLTSASQFPAGMTFLADYNDGLLDADRSGGSPTATFAASRDATHPATYIDSSGVMQLTTTSNVGRFNEGFYDTSGFTAFGKKGVMIEGASTNFLTDSMFGRAIGADDWASTFGTFTDTATDLINISGAKERNMAYTFGGAEGDFEESLQQITANGSFDASGGNIDITLSFWAKGTTAGITTGRADTVFVGVNGVQDDNTFEEVAIGIKLDDATLTNLSVTEFKRFTYSGTLADAATDKVVVQFIQIQDGDKPTNGEDFDITLTGVQVEKQPFATFFIPTTTAALTRNAEVLKYVISGNRTAAVEAMGIKLAPEYADTITTTESRITDTDTKRRRVEFESGNNDVTIFANDSDPGNSRVTDLINDTWIANVEMTLGYNIQHSSPYVAGFLDGVADGTNETADDFINPALGTYFCIGSKISGPNQLNGTIFSIAFFDRVLSASEHLSLHNKE